MSGFIRMALKAQFNMGPYQNIFLFKIAHAKLIKSLYLLRCLLLAVVLEVGVVEFLEGVLETSDPSGNLLNLNSFRNCARNKLRLNYFSHHIGLFCPRR